MTRIKNKSKIPLAIPNLDDYFIGSKQDNNGKTVNFDFNSVIGTINSANGLSTISTISYKFSTTEDATTEAGYFNTNGDEVDFGSITQIVISDTDYNGVDLSSLLSNLVDNKETILLYLKNPATQDLYSYFKVTLGVISTDYATLTVERLGTLSLGSLTDDTSYTLGFITVPESTQSDFAIDDVSSPAHILNRPTNTSDFTNDGEGLDRFVEEAELGDVAFSNDYDDLNNRITTTGEITNNGEGLDRFVEDQELGEVAFSNEYEDLDNKPVFKVVENEYANMAALYADRGNQTNTFIQYVLDASAHPDVTSGAKYFEYLGTTVGDNSDYRLLTDEESAPIGTNIAKTSDIPLNDGEDGSSRFIEEDELGLVAITDDYEDLVNTPENLSDFTDDIGAAEAIAPFKIFVSTGGSNMTGVLENKEKPFATIDYAITQIPATSNLWEIVILTNGVYEINDVIPLKNIKISSTEDCTVSFNNNTNSYFTSAGTGQASNSYLLSFELPKGTLNLEPSSGTKRIQFTRIELFVKNVNIGSSFEFYRITGMETDIITLNLVGTFINWFQTFTKNSTISVNNILGTGNITLFKTKIDAKVIIDFKCPNITSTGTLTINVPVNSTTTLNCFLSKISTTTSAQSSLNTGSAGDYNNCYYYFINGVITGAAVFSMNYTKIVGNLECTTTNTTLDFLEGANDHYLLNGKLKLNGYSSIIRGNTSNIVLNNYSIETDGAYLAAWSGSDFDYTSSDATIKTFGYCTFYNTDNSGDIIKYNVTGSITGVTFDIVGDFSTNGKIQGFNYPKALTIIKKSSSTSEKSKEIVIKNKGQLLIHNHL